jgi:hypothetical protein
MSLSLIGTEKGTSFDLESFLSPFWYDIRPLHIALNLITMDCPHTRYFQEPENPSTIVRVAELLVEVLS